MQETKNDRLMVSCNIYDHCSEGIIYSLTLKNKDISVSVTNLGCAITAVNAPDRDGSLENIVAGYNNLMDYRHNSHYFGCILGRYANRISGGNIRIGQQTYHLSQNDGAAHLHGGFEGFNKKLFDVTTLVQEDNKAGVVLDYLSKDGEEGYPGNLKVTVSYSLNNQNQLLMKYEAYTDQPTPVNLANHSYFNLTGFESCDILEHSLYINASYYTEMPEDIPNGNILPLTGTSLDFKLPRMIGSNTGLFASGHGYNQNYVLQEHHPGELVLAAKLQEHTSGRTLAVYTDQPGLQLYTANAWDGEICGSQGKNYHRYGAVALETQNFPDSPNHPNFPDSILKPGEKYSTTTIYEFGVE